MKKRSFIMILFTALITLPLSAQNTDWDFFWGKFVSPSDTTTKADVKVKVPFSWNKYDLPEEIKAVAKTGKGSGTYRIKLTDLKPNQEYAFPVYKLCYTAFTVLCGDKVIFRSGEPNEDWEKTKAEQYFDKAVFSTDKNGTALITIYASNSYYRKGGFRGNFKISELPVYEKQYNRQLCSYGIFAGILLVMSLYCFILEIFRKGKSSLYIGILIFAIFTRVVTTVFPLLKILFPSMPFSTMLRIEYIAPFLIPASQIMYFDSLNKKIFNHIPVKILALPALIFLLLDFTLPLYFLNRLVPAMQGYMFLIIGLSLVLFIIRIINDKDFISTMAVVALIIIALGTTNDILVINQKSFLGGLDLLGLSFVLYAFLQIIILAYVQDRNYRMVVELNNDIVITNKAYYRFVPKEILQLLGRDNITEVAPGDYKVLQMGLLSADVRNFTATSEKLTAFQVFQLLNIYLQRVAPLIRKNNGIIEKYLGDGIVAIFPDGATPALKCAMEMQNEMTKLRQELILKGLPAIKIGIGVHWGNVVLGTGGNISRMTEVSLSKDIDIVVNTEAATKTYEKNILITAQAKEQINLEHQREQNENNTDFTVYPVEQTDNALYFIN